MNNFENVILEKNAVYNDDGEAVIFGSKSNTVRLDSYFRDYDGSIDFIKMDIEGYEKFALDGMALILKKNENVKLMTEYYPQLLRENGSNPIELLKIIRDFGFEVFDIWQDLKPVNNDELLKTYPNKDNLCTNLFCTKVNRSRL